MKMDALTVKDLTVQFAGAGQPALERVSFVLEAGQIAMLIGPNGCGKTTLLRSILGFVAASGSVDVFGQPVQEAYRMIGYVPQHLRFDATLPLTAREVLYMPVRCMPRAQRASVAWAIDRFHLADFLKQPVGTLSGGQLKRLLLARALMNDSRLLLLDEPEAGVDAGGTEMLYQLLAQLVAERQLTALVVSHELNIVVQVASQVLCLNRRLLGIGPPTEMLTREAIFGLYGPTAALFRHDHEGHA
jgi:ABC-type Mn2+/Zn2+ transport system ATPase subunit